MKSIVIGEVPDETGEYARHFGDVPTFVIVIQRPPFASPEMNNTDCAKLGIAISYSAGVVKSAPAAV